MIVLKVIGCIIAGIELIGVAMLIEKEEEEAEENERRNRRR